MKTGLMRRRSNLINTKLANRFATFPNEEIIAVAPKHWFVLIPSVTLCFLAAAFITAVEAEVFLVFLHLPQLFLLAFLAMLLVISGALIKIAVDWYSHVYIITTHKLLEVCYAPLFSHKINEVLLDQVRCTEVDVTIGGILHEIIDMGDINITFDRPTHQEMFTLENIENPNIIGPLLADALESMPFKNANEMWYKTKASSKFHFIKELLPTMQTRGDIYVN